MFSDLVQKAKKTLQQLLLEISRFQFNVHHDYTQDLFDFRLNVRFSFRLNYHRAAAPAPGPEAKAVKAHQLRLLVHLHSDEVLHEHARRVRVVVVHVPADGPGEGRDRVRFSRRVLLLGSQLGSQPQRTLCRTADITPRDLR